MTAKCKTCSTYWNISTRQRIPKSGYECPRCEKKRKKSPVAATTKAQNKINLSAV